MGEPAPGHIAPGRVHGNDPLPQAHPGIDLGFKFPDAVPLSRCKGRHLPVGKPDIIFYRIRDRVYQLLFFLFAENEIILPVIKLQGHCLHRFFPVFSDIVQKALNNGPDFITAGFSALFGFFDM